VNPGINPGNIDKNPEFVQANPKYIKPKTT
jgi:hypothetical protein